MKKKITPDSMRLKLCELVFNKNFDLKEAARVLDIKYKTAYTICQIFLKQSRSNKKKPTGRKKCFLPDIEAKIVEFFNRNVDATLIKCKKFLEETKQNDESRVPSLATIDRILSKNKYSLKDLIPVNERRNSVETIQLRKKFAIKYTQLEDSRNFIYIDEFGIEFTMRRRKGRSRVGTPATITTPSSRGNNLSVCAAIDSTGYLYHFKKFHSFDHASFITFLEGLIPLLDTSKRNVLIMDNASIHKVTEVKKLIFENKLEYLYNAPWSPMLNPIEECFSKIKCFIRSKHSINNCDLMAAVDEAFAKVTRSDCQGFIRHSKRFFPMCFNEQPIQTSVEINDEIESEFDFQDDSEDELVRMDDRF